MRRAAVFAVSCCAVMINAGVVYAGTTPGAIVDIQGTLHGDWILESQSFIPGASGGHFGLDTLSLTELVPGTVEDPARQPVDARPAARWDDLWISVFRDPTNEDAMISIDKSVLNLTDVHWTDFHMEVGTLIEPCQDVIPDPLIPIPGLNFKSDPAPVEETGKFGPAMFGMNGGPPSLWWFAGSNGGVDKVLEYPGVWPQESADFWLGLTIPAELFRPVNPRPENTVDHEVATFVLRQHWTPTPGAAGVMALAFGAAGVRRRRGS